MRELFLPREKKEHIIAVLLFINRRKEERQLCVSFILGCISYLIKTLRPWWI